MSSHSHTSTADRAGIASAVLCTIHCLLIPALFLVKVWWGAANGLTLPYWWAYLDYLFLIISFMAVRHAAMHTTSPRVKRSLWAFWSILVIAIVFEDMLHWMAYIASAGLITTHIINIRRMKKMAVKEQALPDGQSLKEF